MTAGSTISLVLPFYNEEDYLPATLAALAGQSDRDFELILVDNGSTDRSAQIAGGAGALMPDIPVRTIEEKRPGKIHALMTGIAAASGDIVATLDADTIYPPAYVARVRALLGDGAVAALAFVLPPGSEEYASPLQRLYADLLPRKCHTGGAGEAFVRAALERAGGFDPARWPYVLEDHEIVHRVEKLGRLAYAPEHVCFASDRRSDRSDCSWSRGERILYKLVPAGLMDWFFYGFLGRRFERRGLANLRLRGKSWEG